MTQTDRIEKQIALKAPRSRIWRALTNATEFGSWFGVKLDTEFVVGQHATGRITHPGYDHLAWDVLVERMDAEHLFSFRWHPYAIETDVDYSSEPKTLVEFRLEETTDGTLLTVVECGFDGIPADRRDLAFRMNEGGWAEQMKSIQRFVSG